MQNSPEVSRVRDEHFSRFRMVGQVHDYMRDYPVDERISQILWDVLNSTRPYHMDQSPALVYHRPGSYYSNWRAIVGAPGRIGHLAVSFIRRDWSIYDVMDVADKLNQITCRITPAAWDSLSLKEQRHILGAAAHWTEETMMSDNILRERLLPTSWIWHNHVQDLYNLRDNEWDQAIDDELRAIGEWDQLGRSVVTPPFEAGGDDENDAGEPPKSLYGVIAELEELKSAVKELQAKDAPVKATNPDNFDDNSRESWNSWPAEEPANSDVAPNDYDDDFSASDWNTCAAPDALDSPVLSTSRDDLPPKASDTHTGNKDATSSDEQPDDHLAGNFTPKSHDTPTPSRPWAWLKKAEAGPAPKERNDWNNNNVMPTGPEPSGTANHNQVWPSRPSYGKRPLGHDANSFPSWSQKMPKRDLASPSGDPFRVIHQHKGTYPNGQTWDYQAVESLPTNTQRNPPQSAYEAYLARVDGVSGRNEEDEQAKEKRRAEYRYRQELLALSMDPTLEDSYPTPADPSRGPPNSA
ncbi:hypothetical protein G7046_g6959 [Stylonectria norvegica]|nr:hypothetical protein G7046_g6959 [Stylonectria norvegica]